MVVKEHSSSAASHAITALAILLTRRDVVAEVTPHLTLCYLLPDEQGESPFEGMRLSTFDAATGVLTVEACIPKQVVNDASKAGRYVLAVAADAIDAALEFFLEQGVTAFDVETLQTWVLTVKPADLAPPRAQQVRNTDFEWS
jgi:hypothetical protein